MPTLINHPFSFLALQVIRNLLLSSLFILQWPAESPNISIPVSKFIDKTERKRERDYMMEGGTPLFPDLSEHCTHSSSRQLDFLPFQCDACLSVFCSQHSSYAAHNCPNANIHDRVVVICPLCSSSVEKSHNTDDKIILRRHRESGECDPNKAKRPPPCAVKRCKEVLTFSNSQVCKTCGKKTCLRHRFASDNGCSSGQKNGGEGFLAALEKQQREVKGNECGASGSKVGKPSNPNSRVSFVMAQ